MLDGISYLDGGVSDAIPVQEAARRGAQTIVVIRTVPSQMFYTRSGLSEWSVGWGKQPAAVCEPGPASRGHLSHYQQFIEKPPGKLRILEIYPQKPLKSMALGSRLPALLEDYKTGRQCGRYFLATVGKLLADRPPLVRHLPRVTQPASVVVPAASVANDSHPATFVTARRLMMPALITRIWHDVDVYRYALSF